ncbi:MAG: response regulator receiver protein [Pseudomonadota bacterium]
MSIDTPQAARSVAAKGLVLSLDDGLLQNLKSAAAPHQAALNMQFQRGRIEDTASVIDVHAYSLFVIDIDSQNRESLQALQELMITLRGETPVIVITEGFDEIVARWLLQIRVTDFATKPINAAELIKTCLSAVHTNAQLPGREASITTFLPATGGVGVTTLAIETAFLKHINSRKSGRTSTCIVDLNFQNGSCADYLDMEPRLNLSEIENTPERLDRQLMEVMLNYHPTGIAVIAAPNRPAEMRSFNPELVTRLLDLAASHFDHVVIDMPRTWFAWTDAVLTGSNQLFLVTEMTVPGLRHGQRLLKSIEERLEGAVKPLVIVNRFEERTFGPALKRADVEAALGTRFAGTVPNNYRLVREAIDRGVPLEAVKAGNNISTELRKIVMPEAVSSTSQHNSKGLSLPFKRLFAR